MKFHVDEETCIGCGLCPSIAEDVFEMNEIGKAQVILDDVPSESIDNAKEAEASCPVDAIKEV